MADDIDDLLDECDDLLDNCHSPNKPNQKPSSKSNFSSKNATRKEDKKLKGSQVKNTERDELHDMIRECMDDGPEIPELSHEPATPVSTLNKKDLTASRKRCVKVFLGGSKFAKGLCTGSEERVCDKLRCTSCDFSVVILNDYEWQKDCDYLFFRNNIPDFEKLKSKLTRKRGKILWNFVEQNNPI